MIIAGAGSCKTRLTIRITILHQGVDAFNILFYFTNKAAREEHLVILLGSSEAKKFMDLNSRFLLRSEADKLGYP
jgi:superfamily I DNA/RNA helicase